MRVRLTQIDGKLPNLALMKLAHWHRARGDDVVLTDRVGRDLWDAYDIVYGSAIFASSIVEIEKFRRAWPEAILGGTGTGDAQTVEQLLGLAAYEHYDYDDYDDFAASLGLTSRGCRFNCQFCGVPAKEGKPQSINTIKDIWRGGNHPKHIHLLDNDFFGQPKEEWMGRLREIADGDFKVCFNQGVNVRVISPSIAEALADHLVVHRGKAVEYRYRDDNFSRPRLYTAWDNIGDEKAFFRGVDNLERAGIPAYHLMAYMLVGFDPSETMERIMYRFERMVARGILPYPMVYDPSRRDLKDFQKWAVTGVYRVKNEDGSRKVPLVEFDNSVKTSKLAERERVSEERQRLAENQPMIF